MKFLKHNPTAVVCCSLVFATTQATFAYQADPATPPIAVQSAQQTPEQLQQLVAPIALYPDALVAQILAASTYPDQVVLADRWMQQHNGQTGASLAQDVDTQPWDPSVKALTQFPSVLANMDKNLSWTSSLGDAYVNQQQAVLDAVQVMRQRARKAGNLKSTPQEDVTTQGQTIIIQSATPDVVYVPEYDPWAVYGGPIAVYPGWFPEPGLYIGGPGIAFGLGFGIGYFGGFGWGWNHWGTDWRHHDVTYNHNTYTSHSRTFGNHNGFNHGGATFGNTSGFHGGSTVRNPGFNGSRGFAAPHFQTGSHSSAFSGFNHGGITQGNSFRGQTSIGGGFHGIGSTGGFHSTGGGGGFHGGGGGFHGGGGGFHGGGGHR